MSKRQYREAAKAKRITPEFVDTGISEDEAREIRAISDHHRDEYRTGLDKVGGHWDRDEDGELVA